MFNRISLGGHILKELWNIFDVEVQHSNDTSPFSNTWYLCCTKCLWMIRGQYRDILFKFSIPKFHDHIFLAVSKSWLLVWQFKKSPRNSQILCAGNMRGPVQRIMVPSFASSSVTQTHRTEPFKQTLCTKGRVPRRRKTGKVWSLTIPGEHVESF